MLGKIESRRRRGATKDAMIGWHHWLKGHEFEQTLGDSEGQGSLAYCSQRGRRVRHDLAAEQKQQQNSNGSVILLCGFVKLARAS